MHLTKFGRFIGEDFCGDDGSILFLGITGLALSAITVVLNIIHTVCP